MSGPGPEEPGPDGPGLTEPGPTWVDRAVGLLTRILLVLWAGGLVLAIGNALTVQKHRLFVISLAMVRYGLLCIALILVLVIGNAILSRVRDRRGPS